MMTRLLPAILCMLCFLCCETQAKVYVHHETATEDCEQARLELEALQAACPSAVVGQMLKTTRGEGNHYETTVCKTYAMPEADIKRLYALLLQVRPNPRYVRKSGGHKTSYRVRYSNKIILTIQGKEHELRCGNIQEDNTYGEPKWLLDKAPLSELRSLIFKYTPKCPKNIE